jgi:hypothetical protein
MSATAQTVNPSRRIRSWIVIAILGSMVVHCFLWFWFQHVFLPHGALPSYEKLILRKFKVERVEINAKWLEPKLPPPPDRVSPTPAPDRAALTPAAETRTFARVLSQTPSSPTLPAGSPAIPQEKPKVAAGTEGTVPPDLFDRAKLEEDLRATREQQMKTSGKVASAGRPVLSGTGAPVAPKPGSPELGPPTALKVGPSAGPEVGDGTSVSGSNRVEDFFGMPGGVAPPPPVPVVTNEPPAVAKLVPQGLPKDKPTTTQKFTSLNQFLNVELFTQERTNTKGQNEGYFLIRITAKPNAQLSVIPKDVFFVTDISSSIGPTRLDAFRSSTLAAISKLNSQDQFKVMVFRDKLSAFSDKWLPAGNPPMAELRAWFDKLKSAGVTDLYDSLSILAETKRQPGRMNMILLMSDGIPTKGIIDSTQIINELSETNDNRTSVFTLSAGLDVNNFLLDLLSYRNQGWLRYSKEVPGVTQKADQLVQQTRNPLFLNLRFRFAGVEGERVYPQNLPNLYQDSPLLLFGRYRPGQTEPISLQVLGENVDSTKELLVQLPIPAKPTGPSNIAPTWARQRIYHLLSRMTREQSNSSAILDQVRDVSEEYKVEVPYF